jgi:hypothetical protein
MLSQIKKGRCLGLDDTQVKLIMPKDLPDKPGGLVYPLPRSKAPVAGAK